MRNQAQNQNQERALAKKLTEIALLCITLAESEKPAKSDPLNKAIPLDDDSELLDQPYRENIIRDNDSFETINLKLWQQC